ncbi:hypothetical protein BH23VER1_BH23VER1_33120 [soil metagenome]
MRRAALVLVILPLVQVLIPLAGGGEIRRDFDGDGVDERVVWRAGQSVPQVERFDEAADRWVEADFQLPDDLPPVPDDGSLRILDLNGDGFDDLLVSGADQIYIALWATKVKPQLGWTKGWSQRVRGGARGGTGTELPPLAGAEVRIDGDALVVSVPGVEGETRHLLERIIAFDVPPPMPADEAVVSFRAREGFVVELVAAEPEVVDPVDFQWGADGRLWVVEMRDYPLGMDGDGAPGGTVKWLEDRDGDGRYETATVFLEGLAFPTGVMPWRGGILVSAAPDIIFAEDRDGDGRADHQEVLLTGFTAGNQQHRANGFEWGLDGWIYTANGDSGGTVRSTKSGAEANISGRDLRFRPDTGEIEAVSSQSQFGRRRDDFGNWFGNNNPTWLWHVGLPEHYLRRNPKLAVKNPKRVLANYDGSSRVYPASSPVERPNQPWSLNHVTSACSPSPYRDDLFGEDFATSVFVSEPVHNAVHREVLVPDGAGFRSRRAEGEEEAEFLASTDPWFRPTTLRTGFDGALYIADMYRFVIEHPEWISPQTLGRLDLRAGEDRGRIYRVRPGGRALRPTTMPAGLRGTDLVAAMDSASGWQRDVIQQLLGERGAGEEEIRALAQLVAPRHRPAVRVQALATLGMLGALPPETATAALADPHPGVRIQALRQSEGLAADGGDGGGGLAFAAVAALAEDGDPQVRMQAAFSLGAWPPDLAEPVLAGIAARDPDDEWIRAAVLSSLRAESALFAALNVPGEPVAPPPVLPATPSSPDRAKVIARYGEVAGLAGDPEQGRTHFLALCATCHRLHGEGVEVGPDLEMVRGKPVDWLLGAILDPGVAVEARYATWTATTSAGETLVGIVASETANSLTFRLPGGIERAVLREEITALEPAEASLMPAGFEGALDQQAMADLLAWLRAEADTTD